MASDETRQRILDAAYRTLCTEGIAGASARAIARTGDFNQALIFYHWDSVTNCLVQAVRQQAEARIARYRDQLAGAGTLPELVAIARRLHAEDVAEGNVVALTQMLAGAGGDDDLSAEVLGIFDPWIDVVEEAVTVILDQSALADLLPARELATAISAMFLGIGLLDHLGQPQDRSDALFDSLDRLALMGDEVLALGPVATKAMRRRVEKASRRRA